MNYLSMNLRLFVITISSTLILACGSANTFDYGNVEEDIYTNNYFQFAMPIHENWIVEDLDQLEQLVEDGTNSIASDNDELRFQLETSQIYVAHMLYLQRHSFTENSVLNPSLIIVAENLRGTPGIFDGKDYLDQAKTLLEMSEVPYIFLDDVYPKKVIDGVDFYILNTAVNQGIAIKQYYYSTVLKGFSLNFIVTLFDDSVLTEVEEMITAVDFFE
jgi:hypothetical protein